MKAGNYKQPMCSMCSGKVKLPCYISILWNMLLPVKNAFDEYQMRRANLHHRKLNGKNRI